MLRSLHIRDFVIVDEALIDFEGGFTVFSGETGAGKSILIDALSLLLGARGDTRVIREGCEKTDLSAHFDLDDDIREWLKNNDLEDGEDLLLRRVIDTQGRSRAYINGTAATLGQLREVGEHLVDIHGQHAHQSLLKSANQYALLDSQGGHLELSKQVATAWNTWQSLQQRLRQAQEQSAGLQAEREKLQWQYDELQTLALQPGEWEQTGVEHQRLAHAQSLLDGATRALNLLDGEDQAAQRALFSATQEITKLLHHDPAALQPILDTLESARIASSEAISDLNSYVSAVELDPDRLSVLEERMADIFSMARKYRCEPEELLALFESITQQLEQLTEDADLEQLEAKVAQAKANYDTIATQLSAARARTSKQLSQQVSQAMQELSMQGGQFAVELSACKPSAHGNEQVEFLVAGHAGVRPAPLAKVASGGELARISLALAVIASQAAQVPTLIFDEVDTGIGGAVAEVVGKLLRELGQRHQVLCVTHLPQVAAQGQHHLQVSKRSQDGQTRSHIQALDSNARVEEISRMLGGIAITDTTRQHAKEMLSRP
ncbi:DNA repair protein RecN [Alcaligenaceae bacterium 429]|nr:DNA repair protein RecN [Alcaligenaceae bacterium 429]